MTGPSEHGGNGGCLPSTPMVKGPGLTWVEGEPVPARWAEELMAEAIDEAVETVVSLAGEWRAERGRGYCGSLGPDLLGAIEVRVLDMESRAEAGADGTGAGRVRARTARLAALKKRALALL